MKTKQVKSVSTSSSSTNNEGILSGNQSQQATTIIFYLLYIHSYHSNLSILSISTLSTAFKNFTDFFGVIYALFGIIPLISAQLSHLIKGKYIYILNPLILAVVFLGMALTKSIWLGIVLICLFRFNWGIIIPKIQSHIDTSITSETSRATTVSTVYSVHNLLLSMMLIISGHLIESYSIAVLLIIYSLFSLLFCLYVFIFRRSYNNTEVPSKSTLMMDSKEL